jgi:hypothetical protein
VEPRAAALAVVLPVSSREDVLQLRQRVRHVQVLRTQVQQRALAPLFKTACVSSSTSEDESASAPSKQCRLHGAPQS